MDHNFPDIVRAISSFWRRAPDAKLAVAALAARGSGLIKQARAISVGGRNPMGAVRTAIYRKANERIALCNLKLDCLRIPLSETIRFLRGKNNDSQARRFQSEFEAAALVSDMILLKEQNRAALRSSRSARGLGQADLKAIHSLQEAESLAKEIAAAVLARPGEARAAQEPRTELH